jgi:hypothetical protein
MVPLLAFHLNSSVLLILGIFGLAVAWLLWKTGKLTVADKGTFPYIPVQIIATIGGYLIGLSVYRLISEF